jgi:hypothetical protein
MHVAFVLKSTVLLEYFIAPRSTVCALTVPGLLYVAFVPCLELLRCAAENRLEHGKNGSSWTLNFSTAKQRDTAERGDLHGKYGAQRVAQQMLFTSSSVISIIPLPPTENSGLPAIVPSSSTGS